jgi:nucleoid DNA-binding protein
MNLDIGKNVLRKQKEDLISYMIEKSGLSKETINFVIEFIVFFLKKSLIEVGEYYVYSLGIFRVVIKRSRLRLKKYVPMFKMSDDFKEVLRGIRKLEFQVFLSKRYKKNYRMLADALGISIEESRFLFALYFFSVASCLARYQVCVIPSFGKLFLKEDPKIVDKPISKKYNCSTINTKLCYFVPVGKGFHEINRREREIHVSKKLMKVLYILGVDRSLKYRPEFIHQNDVPEATLRSKPLKHYKRGILGNRTPYDYQALEICRKTR